MMCVVLFFLVLFLLIVGILLIFDNEDYGAGIERCMGVSVLFAACILGYFAIKPLVKEDKGYKYTIRNQDNSWVTDYFVYDNDKNTIGFIDQSGYRVILDRTDTYITTNAPENRRCFISTADKNSLTLENILDVDVDVKNSDYTISVKKLLPGRDITSVWNDGNYTYIEISDGTKIKEALFVEKKINLDGNIFLLKNNIYSVPEEKNEY